MRRLVGGFLRGGVFASLFSIGSKFGAAFCSFLTVWLIAHRFGAAGAGVFGIGLTIMSISIVLGGFALELGALRSVATLNARGDHEGLRAFIRTATLTMLSGMATVATAAAFASPLLAEVFAGGRDGVPVLLAFCVAVPLVALSRLFAAFLRGLRLIATGSLCDPLLAPASFVVIYFLASPQTLSDAAESYAGGAGIAALFGASACLVAFRTRGLLRGPGPITMRRAVRDSLPLYGSQINGFAVGWIPILAVGALASPTEAGLYRVAAQIVTLIAFVQQAIEVAVAPVIAEHQVKGTLASIGPFARRQFALVLTLAIVPGLIVLVFGREILAIFGPEFPSATTALRIMVAGQIGAMAFGPIGSVMLTTGLERSLLVNSTIALAVLVVGAAILIPWLGVLGAAIAFAVATFLRAVFGGLVVWRRRGLYLPLGIVRDRDR